MAFYKTCPRCGANLDPGEPCDCESKEKKAQEFYSQKIKASPKTGQFRFMFGKDFRYEAKDT